MFRYRFSRFLRGFARGVYLGVGLLVCAVLLAYSAPQPQGILATLGHVTADYAFDYVTWEINAVAAKLDAELFGAHPYLDEIQRAQVVRDYLKLVYDIHQLEIQINAIYADPKIADPAAAAASLRAERDALRDRQRQWQKLAESIIEGQIASALRDEGLAALGQVLPPVAMHFTELPNILVISPRDRIETEYTQGLIPGLPVDLQEQLEAAVDAELDMSSLIVPLGGMALYPSMVIETGWFYAAFEVSAHEWGHHWFFFFPNGFSYFGPYPESLAINETTVSIFGKEVADKVVRRFYPDWAAQLPPLPWLVEPAPPDPAAPPPAFDYGAAMHETRVTVDALLEAGKIAEAEAYMEARRRLFVANGYNIRKLNQAYFAFYGGYQAEPGGPAGEDPIGPAIREIRRLAPTLQDFMWRMNGVVTLADLEAALAQARAAWGD
ncbi:MAG: hypothetical protein JXB47_14890 [Anaerolineae bacterium]|nr:hypothetical protein [Anaerolineae bacterium]